MPGGRKVGEVYYEVTADNEVMRGLAAAEGEAQGFTERVSAMEAHIEVDARLNQLKKDAAEVAAIVAAMDAEKAQIEVEIDRKGLREFEKLGELTQAQRDELGRYNARLQQIDSAQKAAAVSRHSLNQAMITKRDEDRQIMRVVKAQREHTKSMDASTHAAEEQALQVAKLEERYSRLYTQIQRNNKLDIGRSQREQIMNNRLERERDLVAAQLRDLGHTEEQLRRLDTSIDRDNHGWQRWARTIAETRIHLGFFSTTLKGLGVILSVFGPIILSVAGSLGALVAVAGAGIAGATAVGIAGLTGFGLAATGVYMALKPAVQQMGAAFKASKALSDAQLKYGKNSSQARDKQQQFNNTLKGMTPEARKAFQGLTGMNTEFQKLAGRGIRRDFFNTMAEGLKTAKAQLPTFARESKHAFDVASKGVNEWFKGLRSPEARRGLHDLMSNFAESLGPVMDGLGHIGAAIGRIGVAASHFLPSLGQGFEQWAKSIEDGVGSGDQLVQRVGRWVTAMQKVGHFTQAAASALTTFFSIGTGAGENLLDSMTRSLQRWNDEMKRNPEPVRKFFSDAVGLMKQLGPAVGRSLMTLAHFAQAFSPAIQEAATVFNALFDAASEVPPVFYQVAGAIWAVNKALQVLTGLNLAKAGIASLLGIGTGTAAGAGAGGLLGGLFGRGSAAAARQEAAALTEMAVAAETGAGGMLAAEGAATGLGAALLPVGVTVGAIVGGGILLNKVFGDDSPNAFQKANDALRAFKSSSAALTGTQQQMATAQNKANNSWQHAKKLAAEGKQGTKAWAESIRAVARADNAAVDAQAKHNFEVTKQRNALTDLNAQYKEQSQRLADMAKSPFYQSGKGKEMFDNQRAAVAGLAEQLRLATLNYNRLKAGAQEAGLGMLKSLQTIKGIAGRGTALKFRFSDQDVTRGVARLSSKLTAVGKKGQVIKILADSKNAEQAFARLRRLSQQTPDHKRVKISAQDSASSQLAKVRGKIDALKDKLVHLKADDAASSKIHSVQAALAALHDKTVTLTTIERHIIQAQRGSSLHHRAKGDMNFPGGPAIVNERGPEMALYEGTAWMLGGGVSGPTLDWIPAGAAILTAQETAKLIAAGFPAFGKGKKGDGKKPTKASVKKEKAGVDKWAARWKQDQDDIDYWAEEYDLDRRSYDSGIGQGGTTGSGSLFDQMMSDLQAQIGAYYDMIDVLPHLKDLKPKKEIKNPKNKKGIDKLNTIIGNYNSSVSDAKGDLMSERDIRHAIQALELEKLEIAQGASAASLAGQETSNALRQQIYSQFASNVAGPGFATPSGALGSISTGAAPAAAVATGMAAGVKSILPQGFDSGGWTVSVINNYATVPENPHTYSQGLLFELQAAMA